MTPEEIKHILDTTVADKMKPVIKEILEMGGGRALPKITDPRLLANAELVRRATAESPRVTLAEARAQTQSWPALEKELAEASRLNLTLREYRMLAADVAPHSKNILHDADENAKLKGQKDTVHHTDVIKRSAGADAQGHPADLVESDARQKDILEKLYSRGTANVAPNPARIIGEGGEHIVELK